MVPHIQNYLNPLLIMDQYVILGCTKECLSNFSFWCPFGNDESLPGIGSHIKISELTSNGSKHKNYIHPLLIIDLYILLGCTNKKLAKFSFRCRFSTEEQFYGICSFNSLSWLFFIAKK
jgi:hypothetical protein